MLQSPELMRPGVHIGNVMGYVNRSKPHLRDHMAEAAE